MNTEQLMNLGAKQETTTGEPTSVNVSRLLPLGLLNRRELIARLGVHARTISSWESEGMPVEKRGKGRPSYYDEVKVRLWLGRREALADSAARKSAAENSVATPNATDARARRDLAQALLAEQQLQIRSREFVSVSEVETMWTAEVKAVSSYLLAAIHTHAPRIHRAALQDGEVGVERALKEMVDEALTALSKGEHAPLPGDGRSTTTPNESETH